MGDVSPPRGLFAGLQFTIVPGGDVNEALLKSQLEQHGANVMPLRDLDQSIQSLEEGSYVISGDSDFPQYDEAIENGVCVVKPSWIAQCVRTGKLANSRQYSPDPSQFMQDVVLTCASLPEMDQDAIIAGVFAMGGQHSEALSKLTTHIVTTDLEHDKCRIAREKNLKCHIVLPHWFDDCFKLGRKISERPYTFPEPELLHAPHGSRPNDNGASHLEGALTATPSGLPTPPPLSGARQDLSALKGKAIMFGNDVHMSERLEDIVHKLLEQSHASVVDDVSRANIFICTYRDGNDYVRASRSGIDVANLSWLFNVLNRNKYTRPLSKLLHYPVPRHAIPGFEAMKISVSNYSGAARQYLENLVLLCGAEYTKTMKQDNTHLITAHTQSEKYQAAQEWNINIVNHIWLEESYAKCAPQTLSNPRYTYFPRQTNLSEIAGQTSFDTRALEREFFPKSLERVVEVQARVEIPTTSLAAEVGEEEEALSEQGRAKNASRPSRHSKPSLPRLHGEEKENESPSLTDSARASKVKAMGILHKQADDIALYNKEMKRKGGLLHGGRRSTVEPHEVSSPTPAESKQRNKRPSDGAIDEEESDDGRSEMARKILKAPKKAKTTTVAPEKRRVEYRVIVTGDDRWVNDMNKEAKDRQALRLSGVQLVEEPSQAHVLVAPRILRTRKFVAAIASAPKVVNTAWLDSVLANQKLHEPKLLVDREGEKTWGFKLSEALQRARINNRKLLRGWSIFVTKDIVGGFDTFKQIITLNGGNAMLYTGRTGLMMPKQRLRNDPEAGMESQHQGGDDEFNCIYLVSGTKPEERKLWPLFQQLAQTHEMTARIVSSDWLLRAALAQEVVWKDEFAADPRLLEA